MLVTRVVFHQEMQKWSTDIKVQVIDTLSKRADGQYVISIIISL
jgi:hypothetical protein